MKNEKKILWIGIIAFWLFFVLEITTDIWFGSEFPGYNWKTQSLSYIGQSGSPIEHWVLIWGIFFTILLSLFTYTFYQLYKLKKWALMASCLLLTYALGEGLGSGLFPINPPETTITLDGKLHNLFSGIGDIGLVLFPFMLMLMFPKKENQRLHIYLWLVVITGLITASFFLFAKYFHPDNFIVSFKGVWQRIYLLNYYLMLLVFSFPMVRQIKLK
jgi:Protein of unknown function (DUF998)